MDELCYKPVVVITQYLDLGLHNASALRDGSGEAKTFKSKIILTTSASNKSFCFKSPADVIVFLLLTVKGSCI